MRLQHYNLIWRALALPARLYMKRRASKGKEEPARLSERYGRAYQHIRPSGPLIWLHAVSVGESVAALTLARSLYALDDSLHFLVTTNTKTAASHIMKAAKSLPVCHAYQPLDHPDWVDGFLDSWQPDMGVILESDYWPNLISHAAGRQIPLYFASAQLSMRAFQNWQKRPELAQQIFGAARHIWAIDDKQADRFNQLSGKQTSHISTSLKLDLQQLTPDPSLLQGLQEWRAQSGRPIWLLASSHDTEEAAFLDACRQMAPATRPLMLIAPRHPARADSLSAELGITDRRSKTALPHQGTECFMVDSLGEMGSLFAAADLVVLGGSFVDLGGHNPLEPAAFGVPVISGPSQFKNQAAFDKLRAVGALRVIDKLSDLPAVMADWQADPAFKTTGKSGKTVIDQMSDGADNVAKAMLEDWRAR